MAAVPEGGFSFWRGAGRNLLTRVAAASEAAQDTVSEWIQVDSLSLQEMLEIYDELPTRSIEAAIFARLSADLADAL